MTTMTGTSRNPLDTEQLTMAPPAVDHTLETITEQLVRENGVDVAFGASRTFGERTIIPVAAVSYGFGTASRRSACAQSVATPGDRESAPRGHGTGTLGGMSVRPIAAIEIDPTGVRLRPVVDVQALVGRASAFAAAIVVCALLLRSRHQGVGFGVRIGQIQRLGSPQIRIHTRGPAFGGALGRRRA